MYKTHTLEEYNKVMELRKNGLSLPKIFSFLSEKGHHIRYGTISDWIYTNKKPFQDKILSKILPQPKSLTTEKSYILGVLCGDGYIRITKTGQYLVGLDVCDEDFADKFRECLTNVYGLTPSKNKRIVKSTNLCKNPKPRYIINLTSKLVVKDLLKYSKSFKTRKWDVPNELFESKSEIVSAFIKGLFDSDGSISLRKPNGAYLYVCSANAKSLFKIKDLLKYKFKINLSIVNGDSVIKLKSSSRENIQRFYHNIGFAMGRKQKILEKAIETYK